MGAVSPWEERVRREGLLRGFEKWLGRRAGPRPAGVPLASWLKQHLPESELASRYEEMTFDPKKSQSAVSLEGLVKEAKALWKSRNEK